jgi:uncharacterized protein
LPRLREVPEEVIFTETRQGRAILGVVDDYKQGIETEKDVIERKHFLRKVGYKL